jgi:hypothetical protein
MFSLENIQRTQYVPQVSSIPETSQSLPSVAASNGPLKIQVDHSTEVRVLSNFSKYLTAKDVFQEGGDPAIVYSGGFRLDYLDGLKNLQVGEACTLEGKRNIVTSYVGNAVVPIVDPPNIPFCQRSTTGQITQISLCQ